MNYLELICNIDNFAVGKWFREVYAFRMKRESGENPGQYPLEKPRDFDPFGHAGLSPLVTI